MALRTVTTSFSSVSWIPTEAISGFMRVPIDIGLGHYDPPPPEHIDDLDTFVADGRCRFANHLTAWAQIDGDTIVASGSGGGGLLAPTEVGLGRASLAIQAVGYPEIRGTESDGDGAVTFTQTAGGRTGAPYPRRVGKGRRWRLTAPTAWTTLAVTIGVDGSVSHEIRGASPFPRHFFYQDGSDDQGGQVLVSKSAIIEYDRWVEREHDEDTPWAGVDNDVLASATESALERTLSALMMTTGAKPTIRTIEAGEVLMTEGEAAATMALLLDGVVEIQVGADVVAECGPGSLLGERAFLEQGRRTATVRSLTAVKTAEADPSTFAPEDLERLRLMHQRELDGN